MSEAAAILQREWRQSLAKALAQVTKTEIAPENAVRSLELLEFSKLLCLDQALRRGGRWLSVHEPSSRRRPILVPVMEQSADVNAYLFTAACHGNGFIREGALSALEQYPDRLAVAVALIRCDDWVPAVQEAAVGLLIRLLDSAAAAVFDHLQLLLRLKQRKRFGEHIWPEQIEPALRRPTFRELRWKSTSSPDTETRAFAFRLVLIADPDRAVELIEKACTDGHPKVALWGLSTAGVVLAPPSSESLLRRALGHRSAAVRTYVLRIYEELGAPDLHELLERALFDSSRGPRDAAAYLLDQRFGESARQHWRAAIDSRDEGKAPIAVNALAYAAEEDDIERLTPFLRHPVARVRAYALRGLIRAKAQRSEDFLSDAIRDMSGLVVRVALKLLSKEGALLDLNTIAQAYASASSEAVRRQLLHCSRVLGKWDTLAFLLPLMLTGDAPFAAAEIDRWLLSSNRRFTRVDPLMRVKLVADVRKLQEAAPSPRWAQLLGIVAHS
jgi:HEAT repeat protein